MIDLLKYLFTSFILISLQSSFGQININNQDYCSPGIVSFTSSDPGCNAYQWFDMNGDNVAQGCNYTTGFITDTVRYSIIDTTTIVQRSVGYAYNSSVITNPTAAWTANNIADKYRTEFTIKSPLKIDSLQIRYTSLTWDINPSINLVVRNGANDVVKTITPDIIQGDGLTRSQWIPINLFFDAGDYSITIEEASTNWFVRNNAVWIHTGGANYSAGGDLDYNEIRITGNGLGNNSYGGLYDWHLSIPSNTTVYAQDSCQIMPVVCSSNIDLRTWTVQGDTNQGDWNVSPLGEQVTQKVNGGPTFFTSPDTLLNVRLTGNFTVNTADDDDIAGFVIGYEEPIGVYSAPNNTAVPVKMIVLDWKQIDQSDPIEGGMSREGLSLRRIDGVVDFSNSMDWGPVYWARQEVAGKSAILAENYTYPGWVDFQTYNFTIDYTATNIKVRIDGEKVFDVDGCFNPGKFGFYNDSQLDVIYSGFSYAPILKMEYKPVICIGDTNRFSYQGEICDSDQFFPNGGYLTWDFGDGSPRVVGYDTSHVYNSPGNYIVTVYYNDNAGCNDSLKRAVSIREIPQVDLGTDHVTCSISDTIVGRNYPPPVIFTWYQDGALLPNEVAKDLITSNPGTYIQEVSNTGCNNFDTLEVFFETLDIDLGPDIIICPDDTLLSVSYLNNPVVYEWSLDGSPIGLDTNSYLASTEGVYSVLVDSLGCQAIDSVLITYNDSTVITNEPLNQQVCLGEAIQFSSSAMGTGTLSYQWQKGGQNITSANDSIFNITSVAHLDSGDYRLIVQGDCGPDTSLIIFLDVDSLTQIITQPLDVTTCLGEDVGFSVEATGTAPLSYQWKKNNGNIVAAVLDTFSISSITSLDEGNYVVEVIGACGTILSDIAVLSSSSLSDPLVNLTLDKNIVCLGDSVVFSAVGTGTGNASLYTFYDSNTNTVLQASSLSSTFTVRNINVNFSVRVEMVSNLPCLSPTATNPAVSLIVPVSLDLPQAPVGRDAEYCLNTVPVVLTANGMNLSWYTSSTGGTPTTDAILPTTSTAGIMNYYVSQTSSLGCESPRDTIQVEVHALPIPVIVNPELLVCPQSTHQYNAEIHNGSYYNWSILSGSVALLQDTIAGTSNLTFTDNSVELELTETDSNQCIASTSVIIQPRVFPVPDISGPIDVCLGDSANYSVPVRGNMLWSTNDVTGASTILSPTLDTDRLDVGFNQEGKVLILVSENHLGCIMADSLEVTIHGLPILIFPPLGTVCENHDLINLNATPTGGRYSGFGVSGLSFNPGSSSVQRDTLTSLLYEYTDQWNCENSVSSIVTVLSIPNVNIALDDGLICEDSSAILSILNFNPLYNYSWYKGEQLLQNKSQTILVNKNGIYRASVDYKNCGSESNKEEVIVYSMSIEAGGPYTVKLGNEVSFVPNYSVTPSSSTPSFTYDIILGGNNLGTTSKFQFTPDSDSVLVYVRMTNELGCYVEDDFMIYVYEPIQIPEIITPNSDGKNDQWIINNIMDYPKSTVKVYNRWGNIVFEATNYQNDWTGTRNGGLLPVATYYYIIELNTDDEEKPYSGSLTIMR